MKNYFVLLFLSVFLSAHSAIDDKISVSKTFHRSQSMVYLERVHPLEREYAPLFLYYKDRIQGNPRLSDATRCFAVRLYTEGQDPEKLKGRLLGGVETHYHPLNKTVEFMDVSILEEFQSRGYGTQALRTLFGVYMAESRKHLGVKEFLACVGKDKRPIPFYQRLGFKKQGDVDHGGELFFVSSDAIKRSKEKSR